MGYRTRPNHPCLGISHFYTSSSYLLDFILLLIFYLFFFVLILILITLGHREFDSLTNKWGPYIWETYTQIRARRDHFGSGLMHLYKDVVKVRQEEKKREENN